MEKKVRKLTGMSRRLNLARSERIRSGGAQAGVWFIRKFSPRFDAWIASKEWLDEMRTVDDEAVSLNMTRDELSSFCHCRYGMSFLAFRAFLRVLEAKEIMRANPELSVQDVGVMCGFSDRNYLERRFIEYVGMSPAVWRARCRAAHKLSGTPPR